MSGRPQMRGLSLEAKQIVNCAMVLTEHQTPGAAAVTFMEAAGEMQLRATGALKAAQLGSVKADIRENHLKLLERDPDLASGDMVLPFEAETEKGE